MGFIKKCAKRLFRSALVPISDKLDFVSTQLHLQRNIIMSQASELAAGLSALTAQVAKIASEVGGLKAQVGSLEVALNNASAVIPTEVIDAFNSLKAQVQAVDDLVPDAPVVVVDPVPAPTPDPIPEPTPVDPAPVPVVVDPAPVTDIPQDPAPLEPLPE